MVLVYRMLSTALDGLRLASRIVSVECWLYAAAAAVWSCECYAVRTSPFKAHLKLLLLVRCESCVLHARYGCWLRLLLLSALSLTQGVTAAASCLLVHERKAKAKERQRAAAPIQMTAPYSVSLDPTAKRVKGMEECHR